MASCLIDSLVWFRTQDLSRGVRRKLESRLRVSSRYSDGVTINMIRTRGDRIGVPVAYGLKLAKHLGFDIVDRRAKGKRVLYRKHPTPRDSSQSKFFTTLHSELLRRRNVFAVAPTGSGKTVAALSVIGKLGKTALVIVPSVSLANQWKEQATKFLGVSPDKIGIVKSGPCEWRDKTIVIAVVHSLAKEKMGKEFHQHFGIAIWDEAHRMGAPWFSKSVMQVVAKHRLALTATPKRRDGLSEVLHKSFNEPNERVAGNEIKAMPCTAYVVNTQCEVKSPSYGNTQMKLGVLMSAVAKDEARNRLIAKLLYKGYVRGRNIVVLSDRIEQLRSLIALTTDKGIASKELGLFISETPEAEQSRIKKECRIIFATYGMMKEGQDVPRLDMGIDATPRSEGTQAIGRIRRVCEDKKHPVWITLFDARASDILVRLSSNRIRDYRESGVEVIPVAFNLKTIKL